MHVLAMRNYTNVEKFLNYARKTAVKTGETALPPVNLSSLRASEDIAQKWARIDAMDMSRPESNTVEMPIAIFNRFLSLFGR